MEGEQTTATVETQAAPVPTEIPVETTQTVEAAPSETATPKTYTEEEYQAAEKRRLDTVTAFTKAQMEAAELKAQVEAFRAKEVESKRLSIQAEMEELKAKVDENPDLLAIARPAFRALERELAELGGEPKAQPVQAPPEASERKTYILSQVPDAAQYEKDPDFYAWVKAEGCAPVTANSDPQHVVWALNKYKAAKGASEAAKQAAAKLEAEKKEALGAPGGAPANPGKTTGKHTVSARLKNLYDKS
jgi:hypothetical protein